MKKRLISMCLLIIFLLGSGGTGLAVHQDTGLKILVDGRRVDSDVRPYISQGRTMVPLRFIVEALGMDVTYDGKGYYNNPSVRVRGSKDREDLILFIDKQVAISGDKAYELDSSPLIKNKRTFIPLRFLTDYLDRGIEWDRKTNTVRVESGDGEDRFSKYEDDKLSKSLAAWTANKNKENFNKIFKEDSPESLQKKVERIIFASNNEISRKVKGGLAIIYTLNPTDVAGNKAYVIGVGDNFPDKFVNHDTYAIDIENEKIYKMDMSLAEWRLIK